MVMVSFAKIPCALKALAFLSQGDSLDTHGSWAFSSQKFLAFGCESMIEYFGGCSPGFGLLGATFWSSSNQKLLSPATALVFVCSGGFDPAPTSEAGQKQMPG